MRTLKNHLILFDAECPMCKVYTQAFVAGGMLELNGRTSYQEFPEQYCPLLDRQRAVNEIALINQETGEVTYGVESLFKVLATSFPIFQPLFKFGPFVWLASKLYAFISFNRRVIIPAHETFALQPTLKINYRIAYLIFTWFFTAFILSSYVHLLTPVIPQGNPFREYFICGGQVLFQGIIIRVLYKDKLWDYLGNMMTISFAGALLLFPVLLLSRLQHLNALLFTGWFLIVAGLMFLEHIRRSKILEIEWFLTVSWVLYRVLVLLFILTHN